MVLVRGQSTDFGRPRLYVSAVLKNSKSTDFPIGRHYRRSQWMYYSVTVVVVCAGCTENISVQMLFMTILCIELCQVLCCASYLHVILWSFALCSVICNVYYENADITVTWCLAIKLSVDHQCVNPTATLSLSLPVRSVLLFASPSTVHCYWSLQIEHSWLTILKFRKIYIFFQICQISFLHILVTRFFFQNHATP